MFNPFGGSVVINNIIGGGDGVNRKYTMEKTDTLSGPIYQLKETTDGVTINAGEAIELTPQKIIVENVDLETTISEIKNDIQNLKDESHSSSTADDQDIEDMFS